MYHVRRGRSGASTRKEKPAVARGAAADRDRHPRAGLRAERLHLGVLLALAFAAKASVLAGLHDHPLLRPEGGLDSDVYARLARQVAGGDLVLGPEPFFVSPLYVYFAGLVLALTDGSLLAVKLVQVLLGTVAVGLVYTAGRAWSGHVAALAGAALAALTGVLAFNEVLVLQSALDPFLGALALCLLARALTGLHGTRFAAAGAAFGLLALNRPNALLAASAVGLAIALVPAPRRVARAALFAAGIALALAPATLRNRAVSGEWVLVSSHGGLNFFIGNNPEADGTYRSVPGITPSIEGQARDAARVAGEALGRPATAGEASAFFFRRALDWIRAEPGAALALFARKLSYVLNEADLGLNYSYAYYRSDERTVLRALVVGPWLLVPLGVLGLAVEARRHGAPYVAWAVFAPAYAISVALFFVASRYRLPLLVALCVTAPAGARWAVEALRARAPRRILAGAAALALLAGLALRPTGLDEGGWEDRTALLEYHIAERRFHDVEPLLQRAEREHPAPALLHFRVGRALHRAGRPGDAVRHLEKARALDPGRAEIAYALGQALLDAGRSAEAVPHLRAAVAGGVRADVAGFDLARALARTGNRDEARAVLRRLALPKEMDSGSALALGTFALEIGDAEQAHRFLEAGAAAHPRDAALRERLGATLVLLKRPAEALAALDEALRLEPARASAHLNRAVALAELGRRAEARAAARRALELSPGYAPARALLAELSR